MVDPLRLLHERSRSLGFLLWDCRHTVFVVAVVEGLCVVTQTAIELGLVSRDLLSASRSTPWGVVTGVFTHWDPSLLWANVEALLFFMALFIFSNSPVSRTERMRRGRWFAVLVFPIALVVNAVYVVLSPGSSLGASGLVYAGLGITFALLLSNAISQARALYRLVRMKRSEAGARGTRSLAGYWFTVNVLFFLILIYLVVLGQSLRDAARPARSVGRGKGRGLKAST